MSSSRSRDLHNRLGHPVIDSDGHFAEILPVFFDYLKEVGGPTVAERYRKELSSSTCCMVANMHSMYRWHQMSPEQRRADVAPRGGALEKLEHERSGGHVGDLQLRDGVVGERVELLAPADKHLSRAHPGHVAIKGHRALDVLHGQADVK
jgi:hypothetical protein